MEISDEIHVDPHIDDICACAEQFRPGSLSKTSS